MLSHLKCRSHGMQLLTFESKAEFEFISEIVIESDSNKIKDLINCFI
jgi:hypothetical protein